MSLISQRQGFRRTRTTHSFWGFDPILTLAVGLLLFIGTLLVYAATRDWYAANDLDPQYYLKRHVINIVIGILLAWGTTVIDYRMLRAYTPIVWGLGVIGLTAVLIPGLGSEVNGAVFFINVINICNCVFSGIDSILQFSVHLIEIQLVVPTCIASINETFSIFKKGESFAFIIKAYPGFLFFGQEDRFRAIIRFNFPNFQDILFKLGNLHTTQSVQI